MAFTNSASLSLAAPKPTDTIGEGAPMQMNLAGRYQSRRCIGAAFDSVKDQKLHVRAEARRGSLLAGAPQADGRRRSQPVPEIHFEVTSRGSVQPDVDTKAMFAVSRERKRFLERVGGQLEGEAHSTLLGVHGDILSRTVPPHITLEMYREVVPVLARCVKAYTNSLGRNHKLTAECIERHRECSSRLEQLEAMHEVPADGAAAGSVSQQNTSKSPTKKANGKPPTAKTQPGASKPKPGDKNSEAKNAKK